MICADEKPSNQARARIHETLPPAPDSRGQRVEHTYKRRGALTYHAALDIGRRGGRRPQVFGRSERRAGSSGSPPASHSFGWEHDRDGTYDREHLEAVQPGLIRAGQSRGVLDNGRRTKERT